MSNEENKAKSDMPIRVLFLPCYRDERMLAGIHQFAFESKWVLDTTYYHTNQLPTSWNGDGIITLLQIPEQNTALRDFIKKHRKIPTVDLGENNPTISLPRVLQDNIGIGKIAAEHLISLGCSELGFVMSDDNHFHCERYTGFKDAAEAAGATVQLIRIPEDCFKFPTVFFISTVVASLENAIFRLWHTWLKTMFLSENRDRHLLRWCS